MLHVVNFIVIIALVLIIADAQSTKTLDVSLSTLDERLDVIATEVSNIDKLLAVKIEETVGLAYAKGQFFLDQYFGNGCLREDGFRCGTSAQCVSRLHVCDGWRDCMNGEDEVADMCDLKLEIGMWWESDVKQESCSNTDIAGAVKYIITGLNRLPWFPQVAQVTFELYQVSDNTVLHNGDAVFEYSTKQIISSLEKSTMAEVHARIQGSWYNYSKPGGKFRHVWLHALTNDDGNFLYGSEGVHNFGGHLFFTFEREEQPWHGADLESAYPNCVKTTA